MNDDQIITEADKIQAHELKIAEIEANKEVRLAQLKSLERESRREFAGSILVGIAIVSVLLTIIVGFLINVRAGDIRRDNIIKACIQSGKMWDNINNSCK